MWKLGLWPREYLFRIFGIMYFQCTHYLFKILPIVLFLLNFTKMFRESLCLNFRDIIPSNQHQMKYFDKTELATIKLSSWVWFLLFIIYLKAITSISFNYSFYKIFRIVCWRLACFSAAQKDLNVIESNRAD